MLLAGAPANQQTRSSSPSRKPAPRHQVLNPARCVPFAELRNYAP